MNIIEVKNNLVKLSYEEDIVLGAFLKISDLKNSYIAQILHLEASRIGKTAIARLIFNFKAGIIQAYDGSIPTIQSEIEILNPDFIANIFDKTNPLIVGKLNQSQTDIIVSANLLKDKPIICAEKSYQYNLLLKNITKQNEIENRKTVIFDLTGELSNNSICATQNFKIPLNKNSIDYIFDRGFEDLTKENKAFIQDIFTELNEYIKTVEFIPFNNFNAVIDYEFKRTQKLQLIILRNRLLQFEKLGIFAETDKDFKILDEKLDSENTIIIDLSKLSDSLQIEYITYVYNRMEYHKSNFYSFVSLNNSNSNKTTLNTLFGTKNVFTIIACPYSYKYIDDLKQCSKNMFMFTPIKQQSDFGAYNIFLNKLAENEFILYGKSTKFTPLIIKLDEIKDFSFIDNSKESIIETLQEEEKEEIPQIVEQQEINILEQPIEINEEPVMEIPQEEEIPQIVEQQEINILEQPIEINEEPVMEIPQEEEIPQIVEQQEINILEQPIEINEEPVMEIPQEEEIPQIVEQQEINILEQPIEINEEPVMETPQEEEIPQIVEQQELASKDDIDQDIMALEVQQELAKISIDINDDEIADAVASNSRMISINDLEDINNEKPNLDPSDLFKKQEDTNNTETVEDASLLTDADLDMIESLQNENTTENKSEEFDINIEKESENNHTGIEETSTIEDTEKKEPSITDQILMEDAQKKAEEEANRPDPIEEQIEKPLNNEIKEKKIETKQVQTPIVPVYSAEIPDEDIVDSDNIKQGDTIIHSEFGRGIVEKLISYGERTLCSVNFEQVGRRLLDPKISEMKKV